MMRKRVAAGLLALSTALTGLPSAAYADEWRQTPLAEFRKDPGLVDFAVEDGKAWIVGHEGRRCLLSIAWKVSPLCIWATSGTPVIRQYDGTNWRNFPALGLLHGIHEVETYNGEVWLQDMYGSLAQFNGWSFLPVPSPEGRKRLLDVGPAGVWILIGDALYHRKGWNWTRTELPNGPARVSGLSARSATEAWTIGGSVGHPYVARWDGTTWTEIAPPPTTGVLWDVEIGTGSDIWVTTSTKELAHWNGTAWTVLPAPRSGALNDITVDSDGVPWLLYDRLLHSYADGAFTLEPSLPGGVLPFRLAAQDTTLWSLALDGAGGYTLAVRD